MVGALTRAPFCPPLSSLRLDEGISPPYDDDGAQNLNVLGKRGDERRSFLIVRRPHCPIDCTRQQRKSPQLRALSSTNDTRIIPLHRPQQRNTGDSFTWIRWYSIREVVIDGEQFQFESKKSIVKSSSQFVDVCLLSQLIINPSPQLLQCYSTFPVIVISGGEFHLREREFVQLRQAGIRGKASSFGRWPGFPPVSREE